MKSTIVAIFLVLLAGCVAPQQGSFIPTPEMAVSFEMGKDPRTWDSQHMDGNRDGMIMEFVPEGDSIEDWKEMVAQQIVFTPLSLSEYASNWKESLKQADPDINITATTSADGSIIVEYNSIKANETSIRKLMKGSDGIYMLAYHVRPDQKQDDTFILWTDIVSDSSVRSNPVLRR